MKDWSYFKKFDDVIGKYMPDRGEGYTMASQIVTAVNKLIYKWYNDGDVYDNTHSIDGWANDLSSYANWLLKYAGAGQLLDIEDIYNSSDYENLLADLAEDMLRKEFLEDMELREKIGTIYECEGPFRFSEYDEEDEEECYDDDEEEYYDDEEDDE